MEFRSFGGGPIEKTLRLCGFARGLLSLDGGWESMGVDGSRWESMGVDGSRWESMGGIFCLWPLAALHGRRGVG